MGMFLFHPCTGGSGIRQLFWYQRPADFQLSVTAALPALFAENCLKWPYPRRCTAPADFNWFDFEANDLQHHSAL